MKSFLDSQKYETGVKVSDSDFKSMNIRYHDYQGDWNYTINPRNIDSIQLCNTIVKY
ncbi:MAG: hypothetical protein LBG06_00635 [Deltaproteobacteria bacterium]|nr:hypothetical protein [Deltaproteobacteria bacterium]